MFEEFLEFMQNNSAELLYIVVCVLIIPVFLLGLYASAKVNSTFAKYSRMDSRTNLTAAEAARKVLNSENIGGVQIGRISGNLTDNFNPRTKVISLSDGVYDSTSVAALGVACHEAGHAIQHGKKFVFAKIRLVLVPVINFANTALWPLFIAGYVFGLSGCNEAFGALFLYAGLIVFGCSLLFALITLPTEFDASRRAIAVLSNGYMSGEELRGAKKVLRAAAFTYFVSFMMSALQFLRLLAILLMRNRRD